MATLLTTRTEYKISGYSFAKFNKIYFDYTNLPIEFSIQPTLIEVLRDSVEDVNNFIHIYPSTFSIINRDVICVLC